MPADDGGLMASISVRCEGSLDEGWICDVMLREGGLDISRHRVRVWGSDLIRFTLGATEPDALVKASFGFLLERESPTRILRSFELADINRFFPEYEATIKRPVPPRERTSRR
jgi:hypothetical protein